MSLTTTPQRQADVRRRTAHRRRIARRGVIGVLIALAIAEILTNIGLANPEFLPPMHVIVWTSIKLCANAEFLAAVGNTVLIWAAGLLLSTVLGLALGLLLANSAFLRDSTRGFFDILRPLPSVVLVPLGIVSIGQGDLLKVLLVIYAALWPVLYNTLAGARQIESLQIETGRIFDISRSRLVLNVMWHNLLPYLATGVRIASPLALILAISVELLGGSNSGLGLWILKASLGSGRADLVFGGTLVAGVLGILSNVVFLRIERRLLHWHVAYRDSGKEN